MFRRTFIQIIFATALFAIAGCGGGGGGGVTDIGNGEFSVKIKSEGGAQGVKLYAVQFTATLPTGVTLKTTVGGDLEAGVLTPSGGAAGTHTLIDANYQSASNPKTVIVSFIDSDGFPVGEFLTAVCTIPKPLTVNKAEFAISGFKAYDANGAEISGITGAIVE